MRFERLGWIVAALLAGGIIGMGFQGAGEKLGTVDLAKVFNESEFAKKQTDSLKTMGLARQGVIDFVKTNPHLKLEEANRFRELTLKESRSAAEQSELERLKSDAQTGESKYRTLTTKDKPSQEDMSQIEEFNHRRDTSQQILEKWNSDFSTELQGKQETLRNETLNKVKEAVQQVAKNQGFSMVFVQDVAPYSANDLTKQALDAMNAKK